MKSIAWHYHWIALWHNSTVQANDVRMKLMTSNMMLLLVSDRFNWISFPICVNRSIELNANNATITMGHMKRINTETVDCYIHQFQINRRIGIIVKLIVIQSNKFFTHSYSSMNIIFFLDSGNFLYTNSILIVGSNIGTGWSILFIVWNSDHSLFLYSSLKEFTYSIPND